MRSHIPSTSRRRCVHQPFARCGRSARRRTSLAGQRRSAERDPLGAFDAFGAALRAERADRLIADSPPIIAVPRTSGATTATFRCDGDTRSIGFEGVPVLIRDLQGLRYLERLLASPGREIHVMDLVAVERGSLPTGGAAERNEGSPIVGAGAGLPVIDDAARDAYRRRLAEVDDDIEEATRMNDPGRVDLAERDREHLIAELTSAVGVGGRTRFVGGSAERARTSVTRSCVWHP